VHRSPIRWVEYARSVGRGRSFRARRGSRGHCRLCCHPSDQERLACYDRASGRVATPVAAVGSGTEPKWAPISVPAAPATAITPKPWAMDPDSMIESVWGFDATSERYTIRLYRPNYLQIASYSTRPHEQPFKELFNSLEYEGARVDSTEAQFQLSFKARLWASDDRRFGVWGLIPSRASGRSTTTRRPVRSARPTTSPSLLSATTRTSPMAASTGACSVLATATSPTAGAIRCRAAGTG
jgi:hypothetical protein